METIGQDEMLKECCNCHELIAAEAKFCPHCGQKCTTGRVTVKQLFQEFIESVFNVDSKIFRTIGALFVPGKLTVEYFKGRHKRYIQPVRLFLVFMVLLIASINLLLDEDDIDIGNLQQKAELDISQKEWLLELDTTADNVVVQFDNNRQVQAALDTLLVKVPGRGAAFQDSMSLGENFSLFGKFDRKIAKKDFVNLSEEELVERYHVEGFWNRMMWKQQIKLTKKGGNFIIYIIGKTSWMVILLMPFLALFLKLLYVRRGFYYVEHLVFSFHVHSFMFLLLALGIALDDYTVDWLVGAIFVITAIYIVVAMKKVYQQRWWKTIFKFILVNFAYIILLSLTATATFIVGFFLF